MRLVVGTTLAALITPEVIAKFKEQTIELVEAPMITISERHRGIGVPTIKEEPRYKPERTFDKIDRSEQRRRNKEANRRTKRGRWA